MDIYNVVFDSLLLMNLEKTKLQVRQVLVVLELHMYDVHASPYPDAAVQ